MLWSPKRILTHYTKGTVRKKCPHFPKISPPISRNVLTLKNIETLPKVLCVLTLRKVLFTFLKYPHFPKYISTYFLKMSSPWKMLLSCPKLITLALTIEKVLSFQNLQNIIAIPQISSLVIQKVLSFTFHIEYVLTLRNVVAFLKSLMRPSKYFLIF